MEKEAPPPEVRASTRRLPDRAHAVEVGPDYNTTPPDVLAFIASLEEPRE